MNQSFLNHEMRKIRDETDFNELVGKLGDFQIFHKGYGEPLFGFDVSADRDSVSYSVKNNVGCCRICDLHRYAEIRD